MELRVSGFDWDEANSDKCQKHGLSRREAEHVLFNAESLIVRNVKSLSGEERHIAIGTTRAGRFSFVVFTFRTVEGELKLRPISARYMHKKEVAKYAKEIAQIQKR
jgi:uncharacterized DUF497 family protein